jgi:hypothetical protein
MDHRHNNKASELNAGIRRTIEQLANETDAARQSELFRNYLQTSAAFWDYSWHNQMLIWRQKPDASFVGGFNTWLKCGQFVRKGEKGIAILAPMFFKTRDRRRRAATRKLSAYGSRSSTSLKDYLVICGRAFARSMEFARATLESPLDSSKHIIAQVLCPAQRFLRQGFQDS